MFIGGKWVDSNSKRLYPVVNPAHGNILAQAQLGDRDDTRSAIETAKAAFQNPAWRDIDPSKRGRILIKISQLIRERLDELSKLETMNNGKPVGQAKGDVAYSARLFEYYAGLADKVQGDTIPMPGNRLDYTLREPLGVTAHVVPWNYPIAMASRSIAPALAVGNTVVAKPASLTPLTLLKVAEISKQAGLPDGEFNVVTGIGREVGEELARSPDVELLVLVGSVETGKRVMELASGNLTRVVLELGGKNPHIVFADADLSKAAQGVMDGIFTNAGQMCWAGSRLLVQRSAAEALMKKVLEGIKSLKLGDGLDPTTKMGPLVSESHRRKVMSYIEAGLKEGAKLAAGGKIPRGEELTKGFFVEPTVFTETNSDMKIVREEIFGPVLSVLTFESIEESVKIANDSDYGLYAGVWTSNLRTAHKLARELQTGMVSINEYPVTYPQSPFGGYKNSGIGSEQGVDAISNYLQTKNVLVNLE
jgi:acyl-CoA reductase-like NAD-dependent aldehyde dehydrogenase